MFRTLTKFFRLPHSEKALFIKTIFYYIFFWFRVKFFPFKNYKNLLGKINEGASASPDPAEENYVELVRRAIVRSSRYLPFQKKCLIQAVVAKQLLKEQGIGTTLYIGLAKKGHKELVAHAWLRWGEKIITGRKGMREFKEVSRFS